MKLSRRPARWLAVHRPRKCNKLATRRVCALIRQGFGLREIARRPGMPTLDTLTRWITEEDAFRVEYDRARQTQTEVYADDVVALADAVADGDLAGVKLRVDVRKWHVVLTRGAARPGGDKGLVDEEVLRRFAAATERLARFEADELGVGPKENAPQSGDTMHEDDR
ncbi:MAG: hypothetical protein ACM30I_01795 [Gemmatimonas sp.]